MSRVYKSVSFRQSALIETQISVTFPILYRFYNNVLNLNYSILYSLSYYTRTRRNILNYSLGSYIIDDYIIRFIIICKILVSL